MRFILGAALLAAAIAPATALAQYDYNDDFTRAIDAHYPPLVRLLITKGGKQNTQDANGKTPLMLAIQTRDREVTSLLMNYQPDLSLLDVNNHSAATAAVLSDDADSLADVLIKSDRLQVAQALTLATKEKKRRILNKFVEILGAAGPQEIAQTFSKKPLTYFELGNRVSYTFAPSENRPAICATTSSRILLQGKICRISGDRIAVQWESISNLLNRDSQCSPQKHLHWERKDDVEWNTKFLGDCDNAPSYFSNLPTTFPYQQFIIPELR